MMATSKLVTNNAHFRSTRHKVPVYTSDKRAKFTQRENKKWIRLVTVIGYLVSVTFPAVVLSIYYLFFWDPLYGERFSANFTAMGDTVLARIEMMKNNGLIPTKAVLEAPPVCTPCSCSTKSSSDLLDLLHGT